MKFKISGTKRIPKKKAATYGYRPIIFRDNVKIVGFLNTHSIIACEVKGGHRLRNNVKEIYPWIRLDVDKKGEDKKIDRALKKIMYIKKPSTSHAKYPYKWHYYIPIKNVSQDYNAYKLQYHKFLADFKINLSDKSLASVVQNTNPMGKAGIALTYVNKGKIWVAPTLAVPKRKKLKEKHSEISKSEVKKLLKKLDPNMEYSKWLKVGFALYDWCPKRGLKLYDEWSKGGDSYDGTTYDKWDDFENNSSGDVTIASIIRFAHGEKVDATSTFKKEKGNITQKFENELKKKQKVKKRKLKKIAKAKSIDDLFYNLHMQDKDYKKIEDQRYLLPGFIPDGGFGVFAGKESSGKSWVSFHISGKILKKHEKKKVMFFDIDSGAIYTKKRVTHLMAKFGDRFKYYSQHKGVNSDNLTTQLDKASTFDLTDYIIIVDSLVGMTGGKINGADDVKPVLNIMESLRNAGATVVLIHHLNKTGDYAGSFAIAGSVDFMYGVTKDNEIITLDLKKDRGVYESHTIKIKQYNKAEGENIPYISAESLNAKDELKTKQNEQRVKDDETISYILTTLRDIKIRGLRATKSMVYVEVSKEFGVGKRIITRVLHRYEGEFWKSKVSNLNNHGGRPSVIYKALNKKP